ncbi:hypothetical protein HSBAA_37650 [Vreelandella sulfidaeris]|uniref:Uncharacterized protein n=1 Tax=Vreelandella sulfidaeris TaxID=115553 RepID=A0A455UDP7_9GAMM|nr:hypothetical protein HSBAA_37650 [Halomonas sulfidaeris]
MMGIQQTLQNIEPHFHKGGKYEKFYPLFEAVDTIFTRRRALLKPLLMCVMVLILNAS